MRVLAGGPAGREDCVELHKRGLTHLPKNCETKSSETASHYGHPVFPGHTVILEWHPAGA
jgi:hypothetical protein